MSRSRLWRVGVAILIASALCACGGAAPEATTTVEVNAVPTDGATLTIAPTATPTAQPTLTPVADTPTPPPTSAPTVVPIATRLEPLPVAAEMGLAFAEDIAGESWLLDEYRPDTPGPWPLVVFLHGSGQSRVVYEALGRAVAQEGFAVSVIDYLGVLPLGAAIGRAKGYRAMAETAQCAVRFARERAAARGEEPAQVILSGFSLGAGVGAQAALAGDAFDALWTAFEATGGAARQVDCVADTATSAAVDSFVGVGGPYGEFIGFGPGVELLEDRDPDFLSLIQGLPGRNPDVRLRLIHGDADSVVSPEASASLSTLAQNAGHDAALIIFSGGHVVPQDELIAALLGLAGK